MVNIKLEEYRLTLQLWDTAGQERFRSMNPMYYRGVDAAIWCLIFTERESLDTVKGLG